MECTIKFQIKVGEHDYCRTSISTLQFFFVKADIRSKIIIVPSKQQNLSSLSLFYKLLLKKGVQPSGESPGTHLAFPALVFIVATIRSLCLLNSRHHLTTEVSGLR